MAASINWLGQDQFRRVWKHEEGVRGYGAVFRDFRGHFLGAFAANIDIPSSIAAEVMAVIMAIELAWVRDWKHIWLEVDSSLVLDYIRCPALVPWQLKVRWFNCLSQISHMTFRSTHIFRERNKVADVLANHGISLTNLVWWDEPPQFIFSHCNDDLLGRPQFRFR